MGGRGRAETRERSTASLWSRSPISPSAPPPTTRRLISQNGTLRTRAPSPSPSPSASACKCRFGVSSCNQRIQARFALEHRCRVALPGRGTIDNPPLPAVSLGLATISALAHATETLEGAASCLRCSELSNPPHVQLLLTCPCHFYPSSLAHSPLPTTSSTTPPSSPPMPAPR